MAKNAQELFRTIEFPSKDGLTITADYYEAEKPRNLILMCHRSHCNRGEYRETAPKFLAMGFSCLAIDQRSGMKIFGVTNETKNRAKEQKLPTGFLDAKQDVEAAIDHAFELNGKQPIIILGSSYSAALALWCATETNKIASVLTFSPGEYLKGTDLTGIISALNCPVFATGALKESAEIASLFAKVNAEMVTIFQPTTEGFHGSKILWESVKGYEAMWPPVESFLADKNR